MSALEMRNGRRLIPVLVILLTCAAVGHSFSAAPGSGMPLGEKTWDEWKSQAGWASYSAGSFHPSEAKIKKISKLAKEKSATFVIVGGSWCPDTVRHLPGIMKILRLASVPPGDIHLYGVDRHKREPSGAVKSRHIRRIPTAIVLFNGREMGRIVENPKISWEDDILQILAR